VAAGTYDEQVVINKNLTLQGAGETTVIKPSTLTTYITGAEEAGSTVTTGVIIANGAGNVTVKNLKVDASLLPADRSTWFSPSVANMKFAGVFYYNTGGVIDGVTSTNNNHITIPTGAASTWGRQVQSFKIDADTSTSVNVELKYSTASNFLGEGVSVGWNANNITVDIHDNTITGDGKLTNRRQNGIQVYYATVAGIADNDISNLAYGPSNWATGITVVSVPSGAIIEGNTISNCDFGIIDGFSSGVSILDNSITGSGHTYGTGIYLDNSSANLTGILVDGNTIGSGFPYGGIGLRGWYAGTNTISETISNNVLNGGGSAGYGIYDDSGAPGNITASITGNTITGWAKSISIRSGAPVSGITVDNNILESVQNGTTGTLDATPNWWGSAAGPAEGAVYGAVTYAPWCKTEACDELAPDENGVIDLTPPEGEEEPLAPEEIQTAINNAPPGSTIVIPADTYTQVGAFEISTPNLTIKLSDGTVIQNSSPCFEVTADNVTITSETLGGAVCMPTDTSNGIDVTGDRVGVSIIGIEFDGSLTTAGNAIDFAGNIDHFQIVNNIFHDFDDGAAINFNGTVVNNDGIQGNLFKNFTLDNPAIVTSSALNAQYNNWDSMTAPSITYVDTSNNTYASLRLESMGTPWANQVVKNQTIQYKVVADLQNVTGADFTLSYPDNLTLVATNPITLPGVFSSESVDTTTAGKLVYRGYNQKQGTEPVAVESGQNKVLFTASFTATPTGSGTLTFSEDGFSMMPPSGPSNLVYTNSMTDGSVTVIDLPTLTWSDDGSLYSVGYPHDFTLTITNLNGGTFTPNLTFDSGNFTITGNTTVGTLNPGDTKVLTLQITFTASGEQQVIVRLEDPSSVPVGYDLATLDKMISVGATYSVLGEISMQGRTFRGNVPVALTKLDVPVYGPFPGTTVAQLGTNLTISNLPSGSYEFTTSQARYLNITAALDKQFTLGTANYTLPALMLRGGNAKWRTGSEGNWTYDNEVNIDDASIVGTDYNKTGDIDADCNFDGVVNIFDLALVGGNFNMDSGEAYGSWSPVTLP